MAVTWTPEITVVNLAEDRVSFSATRVDDDPVTGSTRTYSAGTGIVTTVAHKRAMEDRVWDEYQAALAEEAAVAAKVNAWLVEAKANLEAKE